MSLYTIARAYSGYQTIEREDLLDAVRYVFSIEGDLLHNGRVLVSCLQYSYETNKENLASVGINLYHKNNRVCFEWLEQSMNKQRYFANIIDLKLIGFIDRAEIHISHYRSLKSEIEFTSLEEVKQYAKDNIPYPFENITFCYYSQDNGMEYLK